MLRYSRHSRYSRPNAASLRTLVALLLALALAACGEKPPHLARLAATDIVLAFGDSLTYGTGAGPDEAYPIVLSGLIGRQVVGEGVPGETTADGLQRLPVVLDEVKPKLLLLCMGGNDMLRKMDAAGTEANLREMVQMAKARGINVVLIGVPTPELFGGPPAFYGRLAKESSLPLENKVLQEVLFNHGLKSDPIHPNAKGYRRVAEAIAELLRRAGAV